MTGEARIAAVAGGVTVAAALVLLAVWGVAGYTNWIRPAWVFEEGRCRVSAAAIERVEYRVFKGGRAVEFKPRLGFTLGIDGSSHQDVPLDAWDEGLTRAEAEAAVRALEPGRDVPCWHDSGRPRRVVFRHRLSVWWAASMAALLAMAGGAAAGLRAIVYQGGARGR